MDFKRLIGGLSALLVLAGVLLFLLTWGGPLNPLRGNWAEYLADRYGVALGMPGPATGLSLAGVGIAGLVFVLCIRRRPGVPVLTVRRVFIASSLYVLV